MYMATLTNDFKIAIAIQLLRKNIIYVHFPIYKVVKVAIHYTDAGTSSV